MWFLDCYFFGALMGDQFPVNSFGPAELGDIAGLASRIGNSFDRMVITHQTKGQGPIDPAYWPGVDRPR